MRTHLFIQRFPKEILQMPTKFMKNTWMHFTLALSLTGAMATVAHAESFAVQVPFAFEAAGKNFTAGAYTIDSVSEGLLVIRGATSADTAALMVLPSESTSTPKSSLIFDKGPEMAVLSRVNLSSGLILSVAPAKRLTATLTLPSKGSVALSHP
jgi:hypothetical protein